MNALSQRLFYGVLLLLVSQTYGNDEKRLLQSDPNYIHSFEIKLQDLTAKYTDIENQNAEMVTKYTELSAKYINISNKNADLTVKYEKLDDKYSNVETENQQLKQMLANLTSDMAAVKTTSTVQNQIITAIQRHSSSGHEIQKVAFDAYISQRVGHFGHSQVIKYDGVRLNLGNSYNPNTGAFTCDRPGTYVFFYRFLAYQGLQLYLELIKNGAIISGLFTHDSTDLARSATMSIVQLQHGDSVWVQTSPYNPSNLDIDNVLDGAYNTFAGFLLYSE